MLSVSVAEISAEKDVEILSVLCPETRVVLNKNEATKASSSTNISATEQLSNSNLVIQLSHQHLSKETHNVKLLSASWEKQVLKLLFTYYENRFTGVQYFSVASASDIS